MSFIMLSIIEDEINEDRRNKVVYTLRKRKIIRDTSNPLEMEENKFKKNFRLSKEVFVNLLNEIDQKLKISQRASSVPNIIKLACLLRFCAEGSYQTSIGNDFNLGLGQSTVSDILKETINVLEQHICPKWIKFNSSREEEDEAKLFFYEKCGIPGIIACVDGTHVKIRAPEKNLQHLYYNRKGYYSLNAMILCNHKMVIKYLNARFPGSSHDSHIWNMSGLKELLEERYRNGEMENTWILGDAGYQLCPYLITPFRSTEEFSREARFNICHTQARIIVERTIGLLKNRFRCVLGARELHYKPSKATQIINVCCALHNICLHHRIDLDEEIENNVVEAYEFDGIENTNSEPRNEGEIIRNRLLNNLNS